MDFLVIKNTCVCKNLKKSGILKNRIADATLFLWDNISPSCHKRSAVCNFLSPWKVTLNTDTVFEKFNHSLPAKNGIWIKKFAWNFIYSPHIFFWNSFMQEAIFRPSHLIHKTENFAQNDKFSNKNDMFPVWRSFKKQIIVVNDKSILVKI